MDAVDSNFFSTGARQAYNGVKAQLWSAIDSEINLSECDIYRQVLCSAILCSSTAFLFCFDWCIVATTIKLYHIIERKKREKINSETIYLTYSSLMHFTAIILTSIRIRMERTDAFGLTITFSTRRNSNALSFSRIAHSGITHCD